MYVFISIVLFPMYCWVYISDRSFKFSEAADSNGMETVAVSHHVADPHYSLFEVTSS